MREETPEHLRTPELVVMYDRYGEIRARMAELAIERATLEAEWHPLVHERIALLTEIRNVEDGL